jgi:hypothetical protein
VLFATGGKSDLRTAWLAEVGRRLDHLRTAETLPQALDDRRRLGRVSAAMIHYFWQTADNQRALEAGQRAQARAELSAAIQLYRAMDMMFWLPQAEAALAQVR